LKTENFMDHQTVIRSQARPGAGKPNGVPNSVFDTAAPAKAKREPRIDPAAVRVERGVPLPPSPTGCVSPWPAVYARMVKGDMVRLTKRQAGSFMSWGKKHKGSLARRTLDADSAGVWRTA
jgi:hypothetical protein